MRFLFSPLAIVAVSASLATGLASSVAAQSPQRDLVVASVNGKEITLGHVIVAVSRLPEEYRSMPAELLYSGVLDQLVRQEVIGQSLEGDMPLRARLMLENEAASVRATEAVDALLQAGISEEDIQAAYEERYVNAERATEWNASHILVESEEEAKALAEKLAAEGADFAEMAKEHSTGPSGPNGGALDWFGEGMMVPEFEEAVKTLTPGQVSAPVQTQFGWHLVKLNDKRQQEAPPLEAVRDRVTIDLQQSRVQAHVDALEAAAQITKMPSKDLDVNLVNDISLVKD